jgi:hypothetical protein
LPKDAIGQGGNDLDDWIVKRDAHSAQRS